MITTIGFIHASFIHQNKVSCFRHCTFYHHRFFIRSLVCLVTDAYEGRQTTVSQNPGFASFTTLPSHKQMSSNDIRQRVCFCLQWVRAAILSTIIAKNRPNPAALQLLSLTSLRHLSLCELNSNPTITGNNYYILI